MSELITFQGIKDLRGLFDNLSNRRLRYTFLHREMESIAFALKTMIPDSLKNEEEKIEFLVAHLSQSPDLQTRVCGCDTIPDGLRWKRFDDPDEMINNPQRVAIDKSVPTYFHQSIINVINGAGDNAFRFRAKLVTMDEDPECVIKYGDIDGESGTLGMAIFYDTGNNDMQLDGYPVEILIDRKDFPVGVSIPVFQTVMTHEFEHNKGHDHTPVDFKLPGLNLLDPFFHGVFLKTYGPWDLLVNKTAYGSVEMA